MKKIISFILIIPLFAMHLSCSAREISPAELVSLLANSEVSLPNGRILQTDAPVESDAYLSRKMLTVVYGIPSDYDGIISAAIRLSSFSHPCEFALFLCNSSECAKDIALFCRGRIDTLTRVAAEAAEFCGLSIEEYLQYVKNATVIISGRYVALIVSSDVKAAKKILSSAL